MYCKYCGIRIADDSNFCQHCGKKLDVVIDSVTKDEITSVSDNHNGKVIEIPTIKTNYSEKTKWIIMSYGVWLVFNLFCLFAGSKDWDATENFYPFTDEFIAGISYYDISEFIVYVVGLPFVIWGIMLLKKRFIEKGIKLKTSFKWAVAIVLLVVIALALIVFSNCLEDDESCYSDYYQRKERLFSPEKENNMSPNVYKQDFNFKIENTNQHFGEMLIGDINRHIINKQISELPSESDNLYDFGLDQYFP